MKFRLALAAVIVGSLLMSGCMAFMPAEHMGHHGSHGGTAERPDNEGHSH